MGVTHAALCSSGSGKPYCDCGAEVRALREELAEAKKFKDGMLDVLGGACPNDHRSTPFEEFKGCTPCLRAELAELRAAIEAMRVAGGAVEFQRAFDEAKIIAARKGEGE